jgi:hypothetical protein
MGCGGWILDSEDIAVVQCGIITDNGYVYQCGDCIRKSESYVSLLTSEAS